MGGTPPMPPGYVPPGLPDVAAGTVNIFRGRLVIVFGPAGTVSGVFVYQPGTTPGPGNPPIVAITSSTTDPYGNAVQPTATPTVIVGSAPNPQVQLRTTGPGSGVIDFLLNNASFADALFTSGVVGGVFAALNMQGPRSTVAGFIDSVRIQFSTSDAVSSSANTQFVYHDIAGNDHVFMSEDFGGVAIQSCEQLTATQPGTGTSQANVAIPEVWHDLRPLSNAFVGTIAGRYPPQFRKVSDGTVEIQGSIQFPGAGGPNFNSVTFANVPANYRPSFNSGWKGSCFLDTNVAPVGTPNVQVDTAGNLQLHNCPAAGLLGTIATIYLRYPLDNTGLINA